MPILPVLSTVHDPRPELKFCDNTVAGAGVPAVDIVVVLPLHIVVSVGESTGASGGLLMVTIFRAGQPLATYDIVAVPTPVPNTLPAASTAAVVLSLLLHVPPEVASLRCVEPPTQVVVVPDIANGAGLTVIVRVFDVAVVPVIQVPVEVITQ